MDRRYMFFFFGVAFSSLHQNLPNSRRTNQRRTTCTL